jgi:class 3 adenylate cyclase
LVENSSKQNQKSEIQEPSSNPNVVDLLLGKEGEKVVDSETLIIETQKRIWAALKKGYEYAGTFEESEKFLRKNVFSKIDMVVLYVDLVGSTSMTLELPEEKIAIIISSFAQEMANIIKQHKGFVLKFVGDAVVGYFVAEGNQTSPTDSSVACAKSMIKVIEKGINPILNQYDYPDLMVKIGMDYGANLVVRYGSDKEKSPVDIMGPAMNITAKIQSLARPNQILIGDDVYTRLHPSLQKTFEPVIWKQNEWKYRSRVTGEVYQIYEYKG